MGLSSAFLRMKDRVKDSIGNFFYPQEEFPDDYDMPRESPRRSRDVAPVPQTPQVTAPVYNDNQDPFRQGYMPPRTAEAVEQSAPAAKEADNLVYFPGAEEAAPEKERESAVRVINARSVTDCYSAITQLRLGDTVILVMEQVSDQTEMRHYVDMLSGACYSLRATITKLSRHGAYLICPAQCRVFVDAATNQLNTPNRPVQRQPQPMAGGAYAPNMNPYAQPQNMNPYMQPQQAANPYAPPAQAAGPYAQPQNVNPYAQQPYQPPRRQQVSYYDRSAEPESVNPATAAQTYANGYVPDMTGSEAAL